MREREVPVWVAALADFAVIVVFVAVGRRSHHEDAGTAGFFRVLWPFAVGLVIGWLATGLYRAPMAFRRAVPAWLITVAVGVGLRIVVQGHDFAPTFIVIASLFIGGCMLGWRGVVGTLSRRSERRTVS
jgi:uncharacterized membrane protein (GlpM family)